MAIFTELDDMSSNTNANSYFKRLAYVAYVKKIPFSGAFELTPRCNLSCPMCYAHLDSTTLLDLSELGTAQWIKLAKEAVDAGTMYIMLTGGEPLLRKDFYEIYEAIYKMGVFVSILSNATMMDEDFFRMMEKYPPYSYSISLYGFSKSTYEQMCGNGEVFNKVIDAIERIRSTKSLFSLKTTVTKQNVGDIPNIYRWADSKEIKYRFFTLLSPPRKETLRTINDCALSLDEEIDLWSEYQKYKVESGLFDLNIYENESVPQLFKAIKRADKGLHCTAASSHYWINWQGLLTPCAMLDEPYEQPLHQGFENAFYNMVKACSELPGLALTECGECTLRGICHPCPATHYGDTNRYGVLSRRVCERTKQFVYEHHCYYS